MEILHNMVNGVQVPLTEEEVLEWELKKDVQDAKIEDLELTKYKRDRESEYPSIGEQLDMIYWDRVKGTAVWDAVITQIKLKYPKPGE